jgi:hypothetical protein
MQGKSVQYKGKRRIVTGEPVMDHARQWGRGRLDRGQRRAENC